MILRKSIFFCSCLKELIGAKQFPNQQNICDRVAQLIENIEIIKNN